MIKLLALLGIFHLRKAHEPDVEETALFRQRLEAVINRARVVEMDDNHNACVVGLGDDLTESQTRALVRWHDRTSPVRLVRGPADREALREAS